ncbi:hypothetical protein J9P93_004652, partial [Salmonella enterica]|nr:hypothetical protein [Salmonella enterica]EIT8937449.1 hypothetical protein [Salmonella enterica subsp. enterica serovar Brunei]
PTLINLNASNGEKFAICRRDVGTQKLQTYSVKGRRLTTLNMWTLSHFYSDVLGCVIFGFSFEVSVLDSNIEHLNFITSLNDNVIHSEFFKSLSSSEQNDIQDKRNIFWEYIMNIRS